MRNIKLSQVKWRKRSARTVGVMLMAMLAVMPAISAAGCGQTRLTLDNIQTQKGFTILAQERTEVTLTLPFAEMPSYDAAAAEAKMEPICVYADDGAEIVLHTVAVYGSEPGGIDEDIMQLGFDIRHTLRDAGTTLTVHRVLNEGGNVTYSSEFYIADRTVQSGGAAYEDAVNEMGSGPSDNFWVYMDADIYASLTGDASFGVTLNALTYARGSETREFGRAE